jgi:hypothetical protein
MEFCRRAGTWICAYIVLFTTLIGTRCAVLCLKPDGSVTIASSLDGSRCSGCPDDSESAGSFDPRLPSISVNSSCPCIDLPLTSVDIAQSRVSVSTPKLWQPILHAIPESRHFFGPSQKTSQKEFHRSRDLRLNPALVYRRSIVILI